MKVELISVTQPMLVDINDSRDTESILVEIARVSSSREDKTENLPGLIGYLIKHNHWSPFEMVGMCVEIVTSRAISLQIIRHRSFSYQQFSQRYAESTEMEPVELRRQPENNRQSSGEVFNPIINHLGYNVRANSAVNEHLYTCKTLYSNLIDAGVAKECARAVLPEATQTRLYMSGTMRSWIHYLQIRDDEHAQLEHQFVAREIRKIFISLMPITSEALGWI